LKKPPVFLLDNNLPPSLCDWLEERDLYAVHVRNLGLASASDSQIWDYARTEGLAIVTKDRDFDRYVELSAGQNMVVFRLTIGNSTKLALVNWLETRIENLERYQHEKNVGIWGDSMLVVVT
jgi:predicted nuclease of predicted toxin-antitoxin system